MDAADLRMVETVARHGSMNRAAAELNTVQSNITARVRALEVELGVPLFQRHNRGVSLTPAGRRLQPFAARIGKLFQEARLAARDDGEPRGPLHLGTLETTAGLRLPPLLASYAQAHPGVELTVSTGTTRSLLADVLEYRLEGAFVCGPVRHADLDEEPIFQEELVLITARSIGSIAELASVRDLKTIVFRLGCSYRQRLDTVFGARGIAAAKPLEFGSLDAIIGCVAAGVGVSLLPKGVVANAWREGRIAVHEVARNEALVDTVFVRRRDSYVSSALSAFLDTARAAPAQLAAEA